MAITPQVANNIAEFKKYVDDPNNTYAVYREASVTSDLETPMGEFGDNAEFSYPVFPFEEGEIPDYDKKNGFTNDEVTYERRQVIFTQDKGYSIPVDYRDLKESHLTAVSIYNNKVRQRDVPAIDRYRLNALVAGTGKSSKGVRYEILKSKTGEITAENFFTVYDDAIAQLIDAEIPVDGLIMYCKTSVYNACKNSAQVKRVIDLKDKNIDRNVEYIDSTTKLKVVPAGRFPAGVEFILVQPKSLICGTKFEIVDFFERSERFSGCLTNKRFVHDCKIQEDRANGVFVALTEDPEATAASTTED